MLNPLYKNEPVNESEKKLSLLLNQNFFNLWSHIGIWRKEGIQGDGQGKEICDGVVVFGNKVLIFSDKNISFNTEKDISVAWNRWFKKSITESISQLRGAESRFKIQPDRIFLDKFCTIPFPTCLSQDIDIHLIAVVSDISLDSLAYVKQKSIEDKFTICDFDSTKTFVHVFDNQTLNLLINELPTIKDFIHYLEIKEKLLRDYGLIAYYNESDLLGYYLENRCLNKEEDISFKYPIYKNQFFFLKENYWQEVVKDENYKKHQNMNHKAKPYNKMLNYISECIVNADLTLGMNLPIMSHEYVLRTFAEESMFDRAKLSEKIIETITIAPNKTVLKIVKKDRDNPKYFMILALPFKQGETESEYSERRQYEVELYFIALKAKFNEIKELSIITMPPKDSNISSYLTLVIECKEDLNLDLNDENLVSIIHKKINALSSIKMDTY